MKMKEVVDGGERELEDDVGPKCAAVYRGDWNEFNAQFNIHYKLMPRLYAIDACTTYLVRTYNPTFGHMVDSTVDSVEMVESSIRHTVNACNCICFMCFETIVEAPSDPPAGHHFIFTIFQLENMHSRFAAMPCVACCLLLCQQRTDCNDR